MGAVIGGAVGGVLLCCLLLLLVLFLLYRRRRSRKNKRTAYSGELPSSGALQYPEVPLTVSFRPT